MRASFDNPPEVWAGAPQALQQITQTNRGAAKLYGKAVSLTWSNDGFNVQGWLVYPLEYDASRTYPMVTMIHGGPSAASVPGFGGRNVSALSSRGYFVFMPNPRGSFGEGESFTSADVKDFGYGDWRDDLGGIDTALRSAPIDANRLGLMGWSYGGYMAMWAETQDDALQGDRRRRGHRQLAVVLRAEQNRRVDDPVLRGLRLPGSGGLRAQLADHVHQ